MTETEGVKAAVKCEREILGSAETATRKRLERSNPPTPTDSAIADAVRAWAESTGPSTHDPRWDQPPPFDPGAH